MRYVRRRIEAARRFPAFHAALFALLAIASALLGELNREVQAVRTATRDLGRLQRELRTMERVCPQPTVASAESIVENLRAVDRRMSVLRDALFRREVNVAPASAASASATRAADYFEIAAFRTQMRAEAELSGVGLKADEFFSFAEYTNTGPAQEVRVRVLKERIVAEHVLRALYAAKPVQLLKIERRRGGLAAASSDAPAASATFELTFAAETTTLRVLLNQIAHSDFPLFVRSVNVQPDASGPHERGDDLVVGHALSLFSVTIEWLEPANAASPAT